MNPDWKNFLAQHGAAIDADVVQNFTGTSADATGQRTVSSGAVLCDLSQFGTLRVTGEEAQSFLQNLLSNDIREVGNTRAQYSSFNTAKGRVLATMLIWREGEDFMLQLPHLLCEAIRKKLAMYVLRAKVKIADASNELISIGLSAGNIQSDANMQKVLREQFGELPQQNLDLIRIAEGNVIKIDDSRLQINTTLQHAPALWEKLRTQAQPAGSAYWDWLNIRAGIAVILPQTQEQFVAQMINFDLIGGINFKKGCYPGQEIVARMQYLGKLKRRMYLAHLDSSETPRPGDELFSADMEGQASGMIVNAAPAPGGGYDLLAAVQVSSQETQTVHWQSLQGMALQFLPPPYPLTGA